LSHGAGDAGEEQQIASKIEDEIEDLNLLGMVEGAVGDVDVLIGLNVMIHPIFLFYPTPPHPHQNSYPST